MKALTKNYLSSYLTLNIQIKKLRSLTVAMLLVLSCQNAFAAKALTVGLLYDGVSESSVIDTKLVQAEIKAILQPEFDVKFIERDGNWTADGISHNLDVFLSDSNVDIVVPLGLYGSHSAGKLNKLNKPVVASFVPDPELQNIPLSKEGNSGKQNYTYISGLQSFRQDMERVFSILPVKKVALLADKLIIEGIPELTNTQSLFGDRAIDIISLDGSLNNVLDTIPSDVDTLLVAPLSKFSDSDVRAFSNELVKRNIKSVSFAGKNEISQGLLLAIGSQSSDDLRLARRMALNIFSILSGDKAADLPVSIKWGERIAYNVDTARELQFELPWDLALTSEKVFSKQGDSKSKSDGLGLMQTIDLAIERNLAYEIQKRNLGINQNDLSIAKAKWWPQLTASAGYTQLDQDSSSSVSPEKTTDGSLALSQLLYSESANAAVDSSKLNVLSGQEELQAALLDTISHASQMYLIILRSQALRDVQRSNLLVSIQNLELAENRFELGAVNETDVLRWQSQIASDKQSLLSAETSLDNAVINLQNFLHLSFTKDQFFDLEQQKNLIAQALSEPIKQIFDQPQKRILFQQWVVDKGLQSAPELKQAQYQQQISQRQLTAASRSRFLPNVSASVSYRDYFSRDGVGSLEANEVSPETNWRVGITASIPLLTGGERQANIDKAKNVLQQSDLLQKIEEDNVHLSIRNALNLLSSSYPAIRLSQQAVIAAEKNLTLISGQYSSGSIPITSLIDAQNSALFAKLASAQAEYAYLIDTVSLMRSISDFRFFSDPNYLESWLKEFDQFSQEVLK